MKRPLYLLVPCLIAVLSAAPLASAAAHTELVSSDPADGATLKRAPLDVTIRFSEPPLETGLAVVSEGPSGRETLSADVRGNAVVARWPRTAGSGDYRVTYRVVADDGHPITGSTSFRVAGAAAESSPNALPSPTTTAAAAAQPESAPPATPVWVWLGLAGIIAAGGYVVVIRARRPRDE